MNFFTIDDFNFKNKYTLLRIDINSPIIKNQILVSDRISAHAKTIKELKNKKAKLIIIAHQGRPNEKDFISLRQHASLINKHTKVKFVKEVIGKKASVELHKLKPGQALLLENIRFIHDEFNPVKNNRLTKFFKQFVEIYVNDAFSISHRNQTSVTIFPRLFKSCIGRVMHHELENLNKLNNPRRPFIYLLGGAKPDDVFILLKKAIKNKKVDKIIVNGMLGELCLLAKNIKLGKKEDSLRNYTKSVPQLRKIVKNKKILTIKDVAFEFKGKRKETTIDNLPINYKILDIGDKTINNCKLEIKKAKTILFKGPPGFFEKKGFDKGTKELLKAIANSKSFSVIAGGHSTTALNYLKIKENKFNYISLAGGAFLEYLAGKKLVGLEAIKKR